MGHVTYSPEASSSDTPSGTSRKFVQSAEAFSAYVPLAIPKTRVFPGTQEHPSGIGESLARMPANSVPRTKGWGFLIWYLPAICRMSKKFSPPQYTSTRTSPRSPSASGSASSCRRLLRFGSSCDSVSVKTCLHVYSPISLSITYAFILFVFRCDLSSNLRSTLPCPTQVSARATGGAFVPQGASHHIQFSCCTLDLFGQHPGPEHIACASDFF